MFCVLAASIILQSLFSNLFCGLAARNHASVCARPAHHIPGWDHSHLQELHTWPIPIWCTIYHSFKYKTCVLFKEEKALVDYIIYIYTNTLVEIDLLSYKYLLVN